MIGPRSQQSATADVSGRIDASDRASRIVTQEAPALLAYFKRRVSEPEDAADLVAQTLLIVWKRVDALPDDSTEARMWLFGIARLTYRQHLRGRRRHVALADALRENLSRHATDVIDAVDGRHLDLRAALATLPEIDREIVRLVHWDGFTLEQVAAHLGKPAGTIRSRYHRARARLRSALD